MSAPQFCVDIQHEGDNVKLPMGKRPSGRHRLRGMRPKLYDELEIFHNI